MALLHTGTKDVYSFTSEDEACRIHSLVVKLLKPEYEASLVTYRGQTFARPWVFEVKMIGREEPLMCHPCWVEHGQHEGPCVHDCGCHDATY